MKKMSDVFKLPVNSVYPCAYVSVARLEVTRQAAHAINHVDALAEALDAMIQFSKSIGAHNDSVRLAKAALASYRGEA